MVWKHPLNGKVCFYQIESSLCGLGNAYNIAAAVCVALTEGVSIKEIENAVQELKPYTQRGRLIELQECISMMIHITAIPAHSKSHSAHRRSEGFKRRAAVVGDMLELGSGEVEYHKQPGGLQQKIELMS